MRIYTRTGDAGQTGLSGGARVPKDDPRIEVLGQVDELNAHLGGARLTLGATDLGRMLGGLQSTLFDIGAHLATPGPKRAAELELGREIERLERSIDAQTEQLEPLREFILPGGSPGGVALHLARTVCRRAERELVGFARAEPVDQQVLTFFNRLSDWLFVSARTANSLAGVEDVKWNAKRE